MLPSRKLCFNNEEEIMTLILWTVLALAAALLAIGVAMRDLRAVRDKQAGLPWERLPLTPLQKLSFWSLGVAVAITAAIVAILVTSGPESIGEPVVRLTAEVLCVAGLVGYLAVSTRGLLRPGALEEVLDERDRAILERAPSAQAQAVVVLMAAWSVILTEAYWRTGQVPIVFMALIFWSCLLVSMMALPIGVLIGYFRN
jgi:hypothetical protein